MIQPTEADAGRTVEYLDRNRMTAVPEQGVLKSWNEHYAFVLYGGDYQAKATAFADLRWVTPPRKSKGKRR